MIYEMFKALAVNGLGWGEFAFAVVVTVLLIHLLSWLAGLLVSQAYYYVQDKEETIANFMDTFWDKVWVKEDTTLNGWYKTSSLKGVSQHWRYHEFKDGEKTSHCDRLNSDTIVQSISYRQNHIMYGMPFYLAATFLIFDAFPVVVISIATIYATLRLTRTVVRISKRVTKIETQPEVTTTTATSGQAVSDGDGGEEGIA